MNQVDSEPNKPPSVCSWLQREDKERQKARKAAGKQAKPLWQEDGKRRGLLDKYDEEDEQMMEVRLFSCLVFCFNRGAAGHVR